MKALSIRFLLIINILLLCTDAWAQESIDSNKVEIRAAGDIKNTVEEVEGLAGIAEYYGKKLIKEIGNRLGEAPSVKPNPVRKKVIMKVGPLRIERYEDS